MTTILIISTDQNPAQSLCQNLQANGFLTDVLSLNLENFTSAIQQKNPDLILLDLNKPNWKAPEICQAVRNIDVAPLVVLSSGGPPEVVAKVLDAGADDYLVKPVSNQMLFASINKLTRRASRSESLCPC